MLQASDLVAHSRSRKRAVERHHEALPSSVRPSSPEALGWGLGQVWARSHTVDVGSGPEGALAPLLDMFNHALRPNVRPAAVEGSRCAPCASPDANMASPPRPGDFPAAGAPPPPEQLVIPVVGEQSGYDDIADDIAADDNIAGDDSNSPSR